MILGKSCTYVPVYSAVLTEHMTSSVDSENALYECCVMTLYHLYINGCGLRCARTTHFFHFFSRTSPNFKTVATGQIALGFTSCKFSVAVQFFPKSRSPPWDYLY